MTIYPPPPPTVSGDTLTINRFLQTPSAVTMRLRELTDRRFIADVLLTSRTPAPTGAVKVDVNEPLFLPVDAQVVAPGAEYPRGTETRPTNTIASIAKYGQELPLTDEAVGREGGSVVDRKMRKLAATTVRVVDTVALAVIAAAVTQTQAAVALWSAVAGDPFLDIMLAKAKIDDLEEGFVADTVVLSSTTYARLASKVAGILPRENADGLVTTGYIPVFAGLRFLMSTRLPSGTQPFVCDSTQLGGIGFENVPSPDWAGEAVTGPQARARRDPTGNDSWLLGSRRPIVPYVNEPLAGVFITGATA